MKKKVLVHSRISRAFHWVYALCIILLLVSGFNINNPVGLGGLYSMNSNIFIQAAVGFIASGVFWSWVYYQFFTGGYKDISFRLKDASGLPGLMKYYFFARKSPPAYGKYNVGQKLIFTSWFYVFILMFLTGLVLYWVNLGKALSIPVLMQKIRFYHFMGSLWFMGTVPVHIYLALTEDPAKLQAIFTGWLRKKVS